ncbi:unnamed protein product [Schistosoma curassoni]|uniref:Secreted protein n=1 Tax=Schistosoma curassoni TaxID=6186 RepID=A0A183K5V8_9TREM|nr:unnamed protein product [Schistosoma curassoni]
MMVVVVLEVLAPYSRTVLTFALKILWLILVDSCFESHMFFSCGNVALALSTLFFTSASDPPCSSMMLFRYIRVSTSSRDFRSSVIGLVSSVLYLRILLFLCVC